MRLLLTTAALAVLATGFLLAYRREAVPERLGGRVLAASAEAAGERPPQGSAPGILPVPFDPAAVEAPPAADAPARPAPRRAAPGQPPDAALTGVLLDLDRIPVGEDAVLAFEHYHYCARQGSAEVVATGGRFAFEKLPAAEGRILLRGTMSGLWIQAEDVPARAGDRDVPVFVRRAGRIDGTVGLEGSGLSHSDVQVRVVHLSEPSGKGGPGAWSLDGGVGRGGEFAFEGVPPGGVDIEVLHKLGHELARVGGVLVAGGESSADPRLDGIPIPAVSVARIRVLDRSGNPLPSARMFIGLREVHRSGIDYDVEVAQGAFIAEPAGTALQPGWFELPLAGNASVGARFLAPGYLPLDRDIRTDEVVVLAPAPPVAVRLDGALLSEPLAPGGQRLELEVFLQPAGEPENPLPGTWSLSGRMVLTEGQRRLDIPALGPGRYRLAARMLHRPRSEGDWG